jgi:hypothetical protein
MRGNGWKNPRRPDLVRFRQYVAAKLRQEHGFVFFHVDGDRAYRDRRASENHRTDADQPLTKLVFLVPYYSIEAWLFQNTERAARLCPGAPTCRLGCADKLARWRDDRGALDEVLTPKQELCLGNQHNAELAGPGYPLDEVLRANKSLYDTWQALTCCTPLVAALGQQTPRWPR